MKMPRSEMAGDGPARLETLIPALVIFGMIPGCLELYFKAQSWFGGDHIWPLGDGMNVWATGRLVLSGHLDVVLNPFLPEPILAGARFRGWVYPPPMLLVAVPFGLLSPLWAVLIYEALSLGVLAICLRVARFGWGLGAAVMLCPAALSNLADSQNGALVTGLLVAGLWRAEAAPWAGGVLLGLASIKPQLGLLIPIYLLARGNWRAMAGAAGMVGVLFIVSSASFGLDSWWRFLFQAAPFQASILAFVTSTPWAGGRAMLMSVFSLAREANCGVALAYGVQAISTLTVCMATWVAGRKIADAELRLAILLVMTSLASPYLWYYDMIPESVGVALLVRAALRRGFFRGEFLLLALLWIAPGLAIYLAAQYLPSFSPLLVIGVLIYAWRHAAAESSPLRPGTAD